MIDRTPRGFPPLAVVLVTSWAVLAASPSAAEVRSPRGAAAAHPTPTGRAGPGPVPVALRRPLSFEVDGAGNVWWVDGFGRIRKNASDTGWQPDSDRPNFRLDEAGNVYFVDSYDNLHRNGEGFNAKPERGAYGFDPRGEHVYWIDSFWHKLIRDGEDLGYTASWQSPIRTDRQANVFYANPETGTLWRNGEDLGLHIRGLEFWPTPDGGRIYYWTFFDGVQSNLWVHDVASGRTRLFDRTARLPFVKMDVEGDVTYVGAWGMLKRNGQPLGITHYGDYRVDGDDHVYTVRNGKVHRDGVDTGHATTGAFGVTPAGSVFHVTDETWGTLYRDGRPAGFSLR